MSAAFLATTLSLFSGFFSLGAAAILYLRYRTLILRLLLLFLSSLVLIGLGSWLRGLGGLAGSSAGEGLLAALEAGASILSLPGLALNVAAVPALVPALASVPVPKAWKRILAAWDALMAAACLAYPFVPDTGALFTVMNLQLIVTIAGSLVVLAANLRHVGKPALRRALGGFLWISGAFLVFLVLDILITRIGIRALAFLDGLSLPAYLVALNVGSFLFAGRFLSSEPLVEGGLLTEACKAEFGLTAREAELVERLLDGSTNQDLADALFISRKTVENHLYNIFQKMDVRNRLQLAAVLGARNREHRGRRPDLRNPAK